MAKKYKYTKSFSFDGHRYYIHGDSEKEVYTKMANKQRDLEEGKVTISGNTKVKDWIDICLETYKNDVSYEYQKEMKYRLDKHITSEIGMLQLKSITPLHCQRIISNQSSMSASHIKKLSQEMKFIFDKAVKNHMILENPAADIIIPKGKKGERRSITDEERKHLLLVADDYEPFILFLLILNCGCRPAEAINSIGSDIIFHNNTPMLHIRGTKSKNSDRYVPIPAKFYEKIKDTEPDKPICPNNNGKKHTDSSYDRLVERLRREMNISMGCKVYRNKLIPPLPLADDFVPYDLRHTYCTDLQKAGVDIRVAQKLMGHSSIAITANIYTHIDMDELAAVGDLLGK